MCVCVCMCVYVCMYVCIANTDKDCDLLQDRPTSNKTATVLTTAKIWSWVPEWFNAKTDWPTDRLLQSNSDSSPP